MCPTPDSTLADPDQINADLQRQLAECRAERDEALARETAMAEVLQVINSSPGDLHHTVIGTSDRVLPGRIVDPACRTAAKDLTRRAYRRLAKVRNSLRVFGCLPVTARGAARRQASEKPRRRKPRGEYAPAAVSVYGDLRRGSVRLGRSRTELPA